MRVKLLPSHCLSFIKIGCIHSRPIHGPQAFAILARRFGIHPILIKERKCESESLGERQIMESSKKYQEDN
jgi:hypothetical protein